METALRPLGVEDCWALLRSSNVGRLAVAIHGEPFIFPVNFVVDDHRIIFRTDEGAKLDGVYRSRSVAFEVDGTDPEGETAWSVCMNGPAAAIVDPVRVAELDVRWPTHWDPESMPYVIEIIPEQMTGQILALAQGVI